MKRIILFTLLFACIACLFFGDLLSLKMTFIRGDYLQQFFPWSGFYADSIKNLHLPLWTKHVQSGFPLFAEGQTGMLYPLNIFFFYLLPFKVAYNYSFLFHFILAGLFMYLYAKKMGMDAAGAFLASVLLCFGSVYAGSFINIPTLKSLCFFPAVLLLFENYLTLEKRHIGAFPLIGAIWGMQLLAGSVQMTFYGIGFSVLYFLYRNHMAGRPVIHVLGGIAAAGMIALLIGIPQLYATFELAQYSNRGGQTLEFALWNSFSPLALTGLVFPAFGLIFTRNNVMYIGLLGLFFAIASLWNVKQDRSVRFIFVLFIAALFFALGKYNPLYAGLLRLVRFYSFRAPSKFIYFAAFFLSVLSAKGFDFFFSEKTESLPSKAFRGFVAALAVTGGIFLAVKTLVRFFAPNVLAILKRYAAANIYGKPFHRFSLDSYMGKVEAQFAMLQDKLSLVYPFALYGLIIIAVTLVLMPLLLRYRKKGITRYACLGVVIMDLFVYSHFFEGPRSSIDRFDAAGIGHPRIYKTLKKDNSIYRIYPFGAKRDLPDWIYFSANMIYDIDSIGLYTPLVNKDYFLKLEGLGVVDDSLGILPAEKNIISEKRKLLQELNVKYIISSGRIDFDFLKGLEEEDNVFLYELKNCLPRFAFSLSTDPNDIREADVSVKDYSSGFVAITLESDREGFLLFSEKYYPGWRACVDGADAEIIKYSDILMAVKLPPGRHTIMFKYEPSYLKILLPVQAFGFLIVLLWAIRSMRKRPV